MISEEATNTNLTVFRLTWLELEPKIYRTQGEIANYYINDEVNVCFGVLFGQCEWNECRTC